MKINTAKKSAIFPFQTYTQTHTFASSPHTDTHTYTYLCHSNLIERHARLNAKQQTFTVILTLGMFISLKFHTSLSLFEDAIIFCLSLVTRHTSFAFVFLCVLCLFSFSLSLRSIWVPSEIDLIGVAKYAWKNKSRLILIRQTEHKHNNTTTAEHKKPRLLNTWSANELAPNQYISYKKMLFHKMGQKDYTEILFIGKTQSGFHYCQTILIKASAGMRFVNMRLIQIRIRANKALNRLWSPIEWVTTKIIDTVKIGMRRRRQWFYSFIFLVQIPQKPNLNSNGNCCKVNDVWHFHYAHRFFSTFNW